MGNAIRRGKGGGKGGKGDGLPELSRPEAFPLEIPGDSWVHVRRVRCGSTIQDQVLVGWLIGWASSA